MFLLKKQTMYLGISILYIIYLKWKFSVNFFLQKILLRGKKTAEKIITDIDVLTHYTKYFF